ncbi:MAG TPA: lasso peptide [Candidatus Baltobacteraceae bacterium]|nr:lasso peptide [Candidatus Baltobacteraceae bacterium]
MAKVPNDEPKKPYSPPVLTIHGTVRELTQMRGATGTNDGGSGLTFKTALP